MHFSLLSLAAASVFLGLTAVPVSAQALPPTSRTVFKCQVAGQPVYSDAPCPGAQRLELEPTRGLNKTSGRELIGQDVQREHHREIFAEAVRPLTGMDATQLDALSRRQKLTHSAQQTCYQLDRQIPATEKEEKLAPPPNLGEVQTRLLRLRQDYRKLRC